MKILLFSCRFESRLEQKSQGYKMPSASSFGIYSRFIYVMGERGFVLGTAFPYHGYYLYNG